MKEALPRLFVGGVGPLPPDSPARLFAPGLRVWGMARELVRAGHSLRLATIEYKGRPLDKLILHDLGPELLNDSGELLALPAPRAVDLAGREIHSILHAEIQDFGAQAIVGCMDMVNRELAAMPCELPMWLDYFGDPMAERQMLSYLYESDDHLADQWKTLAPSLCRGDRFSGCSRRQVGAILGELATLGRLNRFTALEPLVQRLPPWIEPINPGGELGPLVRGPKAPAEAFLAVQTGGFNTWLDIQTLFDALEKVMTTHPEFHFVATGGTLSGHNPWGFDRFKKKVATSAHQERYHLLGWVPLAHMPRIIAECDMGLNVDLPCAEGWLGTRNRIMDWMLAGLPVVSTLGCELVEELADQGYIISVDQQDVDSLAEAIGAVMAHRPQARKRAAEGAEFLRSDQIPPVCLKPLVEWCAAPRPAPDLAAWRAGTSPPALWMQANDDAQGTARLETLLKEIFELQSRLDSIEGSRWVRLAMLLRDRLKQLREKIRTLRDRLRERWR